MRKLFVILSLFIVAAGCSNEPFDSKEWKKKGLDWWMTDVRAEMLEDLISSDTLIGMNKNDVYELLGEAEEESSHMSKHLVKEHYSNNIDPQYLHYLIIKFKDDKVISVSEKRVN